MKTFDSLIKTLLIPAISILSFLIPNLKWEYKLLICVILSLIYFILLTFYFQLKHEATKNELEFKNAEILRLQNKSIKTNDFIHKRTIFKNHHLRDIKSILSSMMGFLRDKYRGGKYNKIISDIDIVKDEIVEIIKKEEKSFDEQLYDIQSHKDH